jgi:hypothetical protein
VAERHGRPLTVQRPADQFQCDLERMRCHKSIDSTNLRFPQPPAL